ncbi:uncharacterized protein UDID_18242 [Ustilago sp. UG-2017a]|nr:uncharacterized protein UDID_18242 [Ustilago sp. UG-2017a]
MTPRPMGPKVMVTTEDSPEEGAPVSEEEQMERDLYGPETINHDDLDLNQFWPPTVTSHEEAPDDDDKGNISGVMHQWCALPYSPGCHLYVYIKIVHFFSLPVEGRQYSR